MQSSTFRLAVGDGIEVFVYRWEPDGPAKAVLQIAHGMIEHAGRYARLAEQLTLAGYAVYAADQRGHGQTAPTPKDMGHFGDEDGFRRMVDDLHEIHRRIVEDHPGLPIYLLGHSMGSFVVQHYMFTYGENLAGAILSGTAGGVAWLVRTGVMWSKMARFFVGARGRSTLLQTLAFLGYNSGFKPTRTDVDWISSDPAEVDKYVSDPLCGFILTTQAWLDFYRGLLEIERTKNIARVPRSLPVYLFSGEQDPVGWKTRGVRWLANAYRKVGLTDVTERYYPGGRHEMLNEVNRAEVYRDLIAWLDGALARRQRA